MLRALLVLAASTAVYAYAPAPDESERGSLTHFISLVASDAFSAHAHAANSPTVQAASAAHESGPPAHVAHVAVRSAVVFFSGVVESVPSYMIACVMVLAVVAVFALCWCVRVPLYSLFISLSAPETHTHHTPKSNARWRVLPHTAYEHTSHCPITHHLSPPSYTHRGCAYCLCLVGAERRAMQAAKKRKKGSRPV